MNTSTVTYYHCGICNARYTTPEAALKCEQRPVTQDKGVKVGDIVEPNNNAGNWE